MTDLKAQAQTLRDLHTGEMLILPNVWDAASAAIVAEAGFPVIATASNAIAAMLGYPDGEIAPWQEMFAAASRIARAVDLPVTVDAEAGYGLPPTELVDRLLDLGAVGCNLEDTDHHTGTLKDPRAHADWLAAVRSAADATGIPLVVNARIDAFLPASALPPAARLPEALHRAHLYAAAGADCLYPIALRDKQSLEAFIKQAPTSVNANTGDSLDLATLRTLGAARVSYGPQFYRAALATLKSTLPQLNP
ncbi:isocitrate lyase/PEP mutase family protein [Nocardia acidivorans]|uniref:isocitrate lyase/PEP mutase family protein n=1 Tax=Nocardia acidivorans TaxID=404580 RepID=UPI000A05D6AA|nr:isocitrate lyase/phosphoenolpyruvate mutase family protein [Nocardia acidivorans]